jgi:protein ImuB
MFVMVVCSLYPRFQLRVAIGERRELVGVPMALAPEPGREQKVGEVSAAAGAFGVAEGMRLGEAMARCPDLYLVPPDPQRARDLWERALRRLEGIGAEVESSRPGEAFFSADPLRGVHGNLDEVLRKARRAVGAGVRLGAAPGRFSARAAALEGRPRRPPLVVSPALLPAFLGKLPVSYLGFCPELAELPPTLERLGIRTLGALAKLPASAVADRFGQAGLRALDLARGGDTPLLTRKPAETAGERLALPEAASGPQLEMALRLLVDRLLARPERGGRTIRRLAVRARFVEGGTWRASAALREASADADVLFLALSPKLAALPAPARELGIEVEAFGPPDHRQEALEEDPRLVRRARLGEAVRQARQAAGERAAMRVLEVDPESRLPERRAVLTPYAL